MNDTAFLLCPNLKKAKQQKSLIYQSTLPIFRLKGQTDLLFSRPHVSQKLSTLSLPIFCMAVFLAHGYPTYQNFPGSAFFLLLKIVWPDWKGLFSSGIPLVENLNLGRLTLIGSAYKQKTNKQTWRCKQRNNMKLGALSAYFFVFLESFQWHSHWGVQKYCQKSAKRGKSGRKDQNWDGSFTLPLLTNTKNRAGYATGLHHARNLSTLERWKCRRSHVMSHVSGGINSKILLACPKKIWAKVCFFGFSKKITFGEIRLLNLTSMHGMIHYKSSACMDYHL